MMGFSSNVLYEHLVVPSVTGPGMDHTKRYFN